MGKAILLIQCKDQKGIVAAVSDFLFYNQGNISGIDQYIDKESESFFMRVEWELDGFKIAKHDINNDFIDTIGSKFDIDHKLYFTDPAPRMALFVTKLSHCLFDILGRHQAGELKVKIPFIISNHKELEPIAKGFNIPFHYFEMNAENKAEQEAKQIALLKERKIDFVVLARYMQILSPKFIDAFPNNIINIHHSFLPAFVGAKPYHAAHARGVKIIGATSHYVTADLDAGPIIEQDVARVRHHNSVEDLIQMGQDVEKVVLSKAIKYHVQRKVMVMGNKTIIFN
jgi:formyltetrahydrofolate deformylase